MKRALLLGSLLCLAIAACQGPPADDAAICKDVVNRLCAQPLCEVVKQELKVGSDCIDDLNARASCDADGFAFGEAGRPTRDRMLECRLPLIRTSAAVTSAPRCEEVEESFLRCPDLPRFFDGGTP